MGDLHVMRDDLRPPNAPPKRHLISIGDLTREDVERLLGTARTFERSLEPGDEEAARRCAAGLVINVFYESSTRTSSSFELAAKRLSADTMSIKASGSAVDKGESLKDTAITLGAYDPDVIVLRHPQIGAPQLVRRVTEARIVNAGRRQAPAPDAGAPRPVHDPGAVRARSRGLHVAIVGDVLHSRVARSNIQALVLLGRAGDARRAAAALPARDRGDGLRATTDIDAIGAADIVYVLRMQKERMLEGANYVPSLREYTARWGVTPERLRRARRSCTPAR
jgi:aspartate carbamoyltransferase catalytic subunit